MKTLTTFILLAAFIFAPTLSSQEITLSIANSGDASTPKPAHGQTMDQVLQQFGEPAEKLNPVGTPPIIKWVYKDFTIYFESQTVIHSVHNKK